VHVAADLRILDRKGMERTGLGRSAFELLRALPAVRPEWTFTVHSNRPDLLGQAPGLSPRRTRWPTGSALGRAAWLRFAAGRGDDPAPDLWLAPSFYIPPSWRGPAVVTIHDLVPVLHPELYRGRRKARYAARAMGDSARRADRILCPSAATRDRIVTEFGVDPEKVVIARWGVDDLFRSAKPSETGDYLLCVGRWEARKGLDVLVQALRESDRRGHRTRVVLAGGPGWGASETVRRLRAMPGVEMVLDPSDEELASLYAGALALVYPSRMEGFGLPIAEAMAGGCPVIASDLPEIREWAQDAPRYVPARDANALAYALIEVAQSPVLRARMAERGRAIASELTWRACAETTAQAMEAAVADRSAGP
jgi:glycosyltransferase involved in cell wall biosynthesis